MTEEHGLVPPHMVGACIVIRSRHGVYNDSKDQ